MTKYCITGANRNNSEDDRASEFKVWEWKWHDDEGKRVWFPLGKKSLAQVAGLLIDGDEVVSGKEGVKNGKGVITEGAAIEISLRIAKNDAQFKITDLPEF